MVINKEYTATCRACNATFSLYNYVGLDAKSLMGSHHCAQISDWWLTHPRAHKSFIKLKEVTTNEQQP